MTGVTIGCFLLGYLILWAIELTRFWFNLSWRAIVLYVLAGITIVTHSLFLFDRQLASREQFGQFVVPATFFDWSQIAAFGLGVAYLILIIRRPASVFGIFVMPLVLAIIAASMLIQNNQLVTRSETATAWAYIHGGGLSVAIVSISLGLVVSIVRIWQQNRLKRKLVGSGPFRLPSLEYLDSFGRSCLIVSTVCIATGLIGGVIMNSLLQERLSWFAPGIVVSALLLLWMLTALLIEVRATKQGASHAIKLNAITFALTMIAVAIVFANEHGRANESKATTQSFKSKLHRDVDVLAEARTGWRA
jgi:hypothetical protein